MSTFDRCNNCDTSRTIKPKIVLMRNPIVVRILSLLASLLVCFLALKFYIEKQETDIHLKSSAFLYWSIPLALAVTVSGSSILWIFRKRSILFRIVMIVVSSIGISLLWQFALEQLVDMKPGAYKEPMLYTWGGATFVQLLVMELLLKKSDEKKESSTIALGLLSFPLTSVLAILVMSLFNGFIISSDNPEAETYLIPADFKGEFRVIYGEQNGVEPKIEDGRRVMRVPENGVLIVKPQLKLGTFDQEFYLVDKNGTRTQIGNIVKYEDRMKEIGVLCYGPGYSMQQGKYKDTKMKYIDFTLYRKNQKMLDDGDYNEIDSITASMVKAERSK